jgi:hypothetical protein
LVTVVKVAEQMVTSRGIFRVNRLIAATGMEEAEAIG